MTRYRRRFGAAAASENTNTLVINFIRATRIMYRDKRVIALVPAYNEAAKIGCVVARTDGTPLDAVLVIDDGSTDETAEVARNQVK